MMNLHASFKTLIIIVSLLWFNETRAQGSITVSDLTQNNPLKMAMPILTIAPDARASAMGDVGVATAPSINDQAWNCAKYVFNEYDMGVSFSYIPWMRNVGTTNINLLYLTGFYRFDEKQAFAASVRYFSLGNLEFRDGMGTLISSSNRPYEFAIDVSYSLRLGEYFSMGAAFRYLRSDLSGGAYVSEATPPISAANGAAADIGFFYNQPIEGKGLFSNVSAGLSITNIGTKMSYAYDPTIDKSYFLPTILRMGGGVEMEISRNSTLAFSLELSKYLVPTPPRYVKDDHGVVYVDGKPVIGAGMDDEVSVPMGMIQSFYDSPDGFAGELREIMFGMGAEFNYADFFKIRTGFYSEPENAQHRYVTLGFGIVYSMFAIDLSYLIPTVSGLQSPLANTVHITLGVNIGQSNKY